MVWITGNLICLSFEILKNSYKRIWENTCLPGGKSDYPDNFYKSNSITVRNILSSKIYFHEKLLVKIGAGDLSSGQTLKNWRLYLMPWVSSGLKHVFYIGRFFQLDLWIELWGRQGQNCHIHFTNEETEAQYKAGLPQGFGDKARSPDSTAPSVEYHRHATWAGDGASHSEGPVLVLMLCGCHLEILNTSEPGALRLLLALSPANPVAGPAHNSMDAPLFLHPGPRNAHHVWDSTAPSSWNPSARLTLPSVSAGFQALSATQEHWQLLLGCFTSCRINDYPTLISSSKSKLSKMNLIKTRGSWVFSDSMQWNPLRTLACSLLVSWVSLFNSVSLMTPVLNSKERRKRERGREGRKWSKPPAFLILPTPRDVL